MESLSMGKIAVKVETTSGQSPHQISIPCQNYHSVLYSSIKLLPGCDGMRVGDEIEDRES